MNAIGLHLTDSNWNEAASKAVTSLGDGLARTVCVARALVENGRRVDLIGLDRGVGLFCAKTLDLPHEQGRALQARLVDLRTEIDRLSEAIERAGAP